MIREYKSNLIINVPEFKCDTLLDNNIPEPLPNTNFFMAAIGPPRSGKTSLCVSLLSQKNNRKKGIKRIYRGVFDNIICVCPPQSISSLRNNIFDDLEDSKRFDDLSVDTLSQIDAQLDQYKEEGEQTLLYVDDMATALKNKAVMETFNRFICNRRHLNLSVMLISQYLNSIPLKTRKLISHLVMFKTNNNKEYKSIYEELISISKDNFQRISRHVFRNPHDYMFIDVDYNTIYNGFNRIEIIEEEEKS